MLLVSSLQVWELSVLSVPAAAVVVVAVAVDAVAAAAEGGCLRSKGQKCIKGSQEDVAATSHWGVSKVGSSAATRGSSCRLRFLLAVKGSAALRIGVVASPGTKCCSWLFSRKSWRAPSWSWRKGNWIPISSFSKLYCSIPQGSWSVYINTLFF